MPVLSVTRLHVRSWRHVPVVLLATLRSAHQARRAEGNLAVAVLGDVKNTFWARSAWQNEDAMRAYIWSGVHRRIMSNLSTWCDEAAVAHWEAEKPEIQSWEEAHHYLQRYGREPVIDPSKHGTLAHAPPPRVRGWAHLRLK
ncbi:hypothetical protein L861_17275 [Litchfieldella anticariensis FP35 = DSM 16096]|uniref:DUF3291 domain-containing protein n=1 Tax=Litchfieldella anticariensis (strain DSM 16096 / CECT 5854 / CIP 108499 / LMG 22089 / FP35) TaxID=1121939 RepID=S2L6A1_LITA3|nr:hypothetical protein [Halomonas anticariensis]EPC03294.1 hypothetical protein L861_17275 [Halomonas anticariensis FP35 = DSM 16096]